MSAHRFFLTGPLTQSADRPLAITADDEHHAIGALRICAGETIEVVTPDLHVWRVGVTGVRAGHLYGEPAEEVAVEQLPRVTLFQGVAKGEKMDDIVRQAVEIGAEEIVPVLTARSIVKLERGKRERRAERWRRVAAAAAKQSKRVGVPHVGDPVRLREVLPRLAAYEGVVVLWEECEGEGLSAAVHRAAVVPEARVALFVGPEGGFAREEVDMLAAAGATVATLGPTILRTETAATVALALAMAALGGLGGSSE